MISHEDGALRAALSRGRRRATLDDLREAVTTLEDTERIARRVFGGAHPLTTNIDAIRSARQMHLPAKRAAPFVALLAKRARVSARAHPLVAGMFNAAAAVAFGDGVPLWIGDSPESMPSQKTRSLIF